MRVTASITGKVAPLLTGCYPKRVGLHKGVLFPNSTIGLNPDEYTIADQKYLDYADELRKTDDYRISQRCRKKIEMLFGEAKEFMGLCRARRRGHQNVLDQCLITAAVQNMKRIIKHMEAPARRTGELASGAQVARDLLQAAIRVLDHWGAELRRIRSTIGMPLQLQRKTAFGL